ncbi:hypothetical protein FRC08_003871 [Ceratobasidium sp. 394]|nr:hypothetical protein FRC08_003871 [Ceratobasidium sp. 394]KAG9099718.1 hypothetical protein FS749_000580 [Ceratobasidium sp. UAMH 11750]
MAQANLPVMGGLPSQIPSPQNMGTENLPGQDAAVFLEPGAANNGPTPLLGSLNGLAAVAPSGIEENNPIPLIGSLNGLASVTQAAAGE